MRRIFFRCGLVLMAVAGLVTGIVSRLMWQPRVVETLAGWGQKIAEDGEIKTEPKSSSGAVTAPRGVDPDVWYLLQERPKTGGWAATLERLRAEGRDDLRELVMLSWCEANGTSALSWLADQPADQWPGEGAMHQWIAHHPGLSWKVALAKDNLALARLAIGATSALAADPGLVRGILDSSARSLRTIPVLLAQQFAGMGGRDAFGTLAATDPMTASRVLELLGPGAPGAYRMLRAWLDVDPAAAEKVMAQSSAREQTMWKAQLVAHLSGTDLKAAEAMIADMPDGTSRDAVTWQVLRVRAKTDSQGALAEAEKLGSPAVASVQSYIIGMLAKTDPAAALAQAEKLAVSLRAAIGPRFVDSSIMDAFAGVDWKRTFALAVRVSGSPAASMLNSKEPAQVAQGLAVLRDFGAEDVAAATRAVTILNVANKEEEIRSLAEGAADNPLTAAARVWLASESVAGQSGPHPVRSPPDAAMAQILSELDSSLVPPKMFSDTAAWWVRQEPERASHWVGELAPGPGRDAAIGGLVDALIGEPQQFNGWFSSPNIRLKSQSSGEQIDYPSALAWATAVGDSAIREDLALRISRRWLDADPIGAADGLRGGSLPAEERQRLSMELGIAP